MNEQFEKWASSKGFNLEIKPYSSDYQDPITKAVYEGYGEGWSRACRERELFWMPMYSFATKVIRKNGLWKEFEDGVGEAVKRERALLEQAFDT